MPKGFEFLFFYFPRIKLDCGGFWVTALQNSNRSMIVFEEQGVKEEFVSYLVFNCDNDEVVIDIFDRQTNNVSGNMDAYIDFAMKKLMKNKEYAKAFNDYIAEERGDTTVDSELGRAFEHRYDYFTEGKIGKNLRSSTYARISRSNFQFTQIDTITKN